jgi:predicted ATP-binding protein involved in virulence
LAGDRFFIRGLRLKNFRCFPQIELGPFDPHFNLIAGVNGAGKSSILLALANAIGCLGSHSKGDSFYRSEDVRLEFSRDLAGAIRSIRCTPSQVSIDVESESGLREVPEIVIGGASPVIRSSSQMCKEFFVLGDSTTDLSIDRAVPVILYYTTRRAFRTKEGSKVPKKRSMDVPRASALANWYDSGVDSDELRSFVGGQSYLKDIPSLQRAGSSQLDLVRTAITEAVEGARNIEFDHERNDIVVEFGDGQSSSFSGMSDGQRTLIGFIADIARRACSLNLKYLAERTLQETSGIILIDEIDLHLHPRWQRKVVDDLKRIFPSMQFFATTHSPQIVGEARPEEIVLLTPGGQKRPDASFGMDSNWVLECLMEADGRDPSVRKKISIMFEAIEDGRFNDAQQVMAELRDTIGEAPDVVAAESYLWNLQHGAGETVD